MSVKTRYRCVRHGCFVEFDRYERGGFLYWCPLCEDYVSPSTETAEVAFDD